MGLTGISAKQQDFCDVKLRLQTSHVPYGLFVLNFLLCVDVRGGLSSYLGILLSEDLAARELIISHLESVIYSLRSELRLQLAMEVHQLCFDQVCL